MEASGASRGDTGRKVQSSASMPGAGGVARPVHSRLPGAASSPPRARLPPSTVGRTGLKDDARRAMGDRLRRVVYLRVGDGDTAGENLRTQTGTFQ